MATHHAQMSYVNSSLFRVQWLIQLGFIALVLTFDWSEQLQAIVAGALLITVGIPHGANDYLFRRQISTSGLVTFTAIYLGVMGLYAGLWWLSPTLALLLFFAISFHHFGQSNFENEQVLHWPSLLWGIWILLLPVLIHWDESLSIFAGMVGSEMPSPVYLSANVRIAIAAALAGAYALAIWRHEKLAWRAFAMQWALVSIWYLASPLLFGFIVVFSLWHSLQSLRHQIAAFKVQSAGSTVHFFKAQLPFALAALLGFGVYVYFRGFDVGEAFILLSLITLPHVLVMHRLSAHKEQVT